MPAPPPHARVSCVIPAYNEAPRIASVLARVTHHPLIDEVIAVDDGSTDGTAEVIAALEGVRLIALAHNVGKTSAVATGVAAARNALILLLDSDLIGLTEDDLTALITPVLNNQADVAISLRGNAPRTWRMIGLDYISGERVVPKAFLRPEAELSALPRFGLEVWMNAHIIQAQARLCVVRWPGVASPWKGTKRGIWAGIRADIAMLADMFSTISPLAALRQIWALRRLAISS